MAAQEIDQGREARAEAQAQVDDPVADHGPVARSAAHAVAREPHQTLPRPGPRGAGRQSTSRPELVKSGPAGVNIFRVAFASPAPRKGHPMPHVICEYSANVEPKIRVDALLEVLHNAMMRTGVVDLGGLRTRAERREHYRIADNHPANAFVNVTVRVAKGRTVETRRLIAET